MTNTVELKLEQLVSICLLYNLKWLGEDFANCVDIKRAINPPLYEVLKILSGSIRYHSLTAIITGEETVNVIHVKFSTVKLHIQNVPYIDCIILPRNWNPAKIYFTLPAPFAFLFYCPWGYLAEQSS